MKNPIELESIEESSLDRRKVVLAVGRLVPQKGYSRLVEGFAETNAKSLGWSLVIIGNGPEHAQLTKLARKLGIQDRLNLLGLLAHEDVVSWYRKAGIFVLTSGHEGTSNAMLEAMACGCPVLISDTSGGGVDLIEDGKNGFIVRSTPAAIREKLDFLFERPELRASSGLNGRARVEQFDHVAVAREWMDMLKAVNW
jgi:glycosyltransferase involved in cell wall biosynthesis